MDINLIKLSVIAFLYYTAIGLVAPTIAPHILKTVGSYAFFGVSSSVYAGLLVLAGPVVGSWSDLKGRKFVIFVTAAIAAVCYLLLGLATSLATILVLRILLGMVEHIPTLTKASIGDLVPKDKLTKAYSRYAMGMALGIVCGPIMSGHIFDRNHGFFYVCVVVAVIYGLIVAISQALPVNKKQNSNKAKSEKLKREFFKIFVELSRVNWKTFGNVLFVRFSVNLGTMTYLTNQVIYLQEKFDLPQKPIGYILSLFGILGVVVTVLLPWLKAKFYKYDVNSTKLLLHQYLVFTVCCLMLHLAETLTVFVAVLMIFAFAIAALNLITTEAILNSATHEVRGTLSGASESVLGIARFLAPLISTVVATYFGQENLMLFVFVNALPGAFVCFRLLYKKLNN